MTRKSITYGPLRRLRVSCKDKSLRTQIAFAKKFGVSQGTLSKMERAELSPHCGFLTKLLESGLYSQKAVIELIKYYGMEWGHKFWGQS